MDVSYSDTVINTIVWGNVASNSDSSIYGDIIAAYSDIAGGYMGIGNINSDPLFVVPSAVVGAEYNGFEAEWTLQTSSPCINSGNPGMSYNETDLAGLPRVDCISDTIDMGAFEFIPEDVMPIVESATVHINENAENNSIVHTVSGHNVLYYKIIEGNIDNAFSIDSLSGIIRVNNNQVLDHESTPFYELIIRGYNNCAFSENLVTIFIDESPDNSIEIYNYNNVLIYSNPAKDYFTVQLPENHTLRSYTLLTTDGKKVKESLITGNNVEINISDLEQGVYILMLKHVNGLVISEKILIE